MRAEPFYRHENQCMQILNLSSPEQIGCLLFHFPILKSQGWFKFLVLCNDIQNVSRGEAVPNKAKK